MRTKTLLTTAMMLVAGAATLAATAPAVAAHDCNSIFGPVGCGFCTDQSHNGTHTWEIAGRQEEICSSTPRDLDLGDIGLPEDDPVCTVITALSIGNCDDE